MKYLSKIAIIVCLMSLGNIVFARQQPNIVIILADNLGYGDFILQKEEAHLVNHKKMMGRQDGRSWSGWIYSEKI